MGAMEGFKLKKGWVHGYCFLSTKSLKMDTSGRRLEVNTVVPHTRVYECHNETRCYI